MKTLNIIINSVPKEEFLKLFDSFTDETITVLVSNDLTLIKISDNLKVAHQVLTLTPYCSKDYKRGFIVSTRNKIGPHASNCEYGILHEKVSDDGERKLFFDKMQSHVYLSSATDVTDVPNRLTENQLKNETTFLLPAAIISQSPGKIITVAKEEHLNKIDLIEVFTDRDEAIKEIEKFTFNCDGVLLETKVTSVPCHLVQKIDKRFFVTPITFSLTVK